MLQRFRLVFTLVFFLLVASCSGAGCGGCGGCAGATPLPAGFPLEKSVENAASVRVSRPGLDFLETNLGPIAGKALNSTNGVTNFGIPESPFSQSGTISVEGKICPGGPDPTANPPKCEAAIDLGKSTWAIDSVVPDEVHLAATIPLQLQDTPVALSKPLSLTVHIGYGANGKCGGSNNSAVQVDPKPLPVKVTLPLIAETTAPRKGYTKVDVDNAVVDISAISKDDVQICADCGFLSGLCNGVLNSDVIKGNLVDQLTKGLGDQVKGLLKDNLCTKPNAAIVPTCPTGSGPDADKKYCVYDADKTKCVPTLLGTDGHMDLSGALKSLSPSTGGAIDYGLAAFGAMNPAPDLDAGVDGGRIPNGITLGFSGGVLPNPASNCVAAVPVTPPTGVPIPDEIAPTTVDPAGAPHVGIALSGRFLDYSFTSLYNSGLLCLGISTAQVDLLKSGLLSFLVPSLKTITFEQGDAAAAITTRPGAPPEVTLGGGTDPNTDPLLLIKLPKLSLDFYIWSFDRFARIFTYTGDLTIPVTLQTGKGPNNPNGGIIPALGDIKVSNGSVTNADIMLFEDPGVLAGAVSGIFGTVSKQLGGSVSKPIDLSSSLASYGLDLQIDQIKKLTKGNDQFVGIFATLAKKAGTALPESDTQAKLLAKRVWKDHMQASTYDQAMLPELELELASSLENDKRTIEYSWWIDEGTRSPWSTTKHVVIKDDQLFFQGKHVLHVVSRVVGAPETEDATPADIAYTIDAVAPFVRLERSGDSMAVKAWDIVSPADTLVARYRLDGKGASDWRPLADIAKIAVGSASQLEVEVKDEEGNIGVVRQAIRGVSDPTLSAAGSSCGCSAPGASSPGGLVALALGLGGLALVVLRRRGVGFATHRAVTRGGVVLGVVATVAATSQGCACGDAEVTTGCGADCNSKCQTGLEKGQPGAFLSVAKSKDGSLWMAGYNDSLLADSDALLWGDLVVGKYDATKQQVAWQTIDGLPDRKEGTCPSYEPYGWRRGETDAGDDVGRYTSLQISAKDQPMVSYYDDTHHRLKFAINDGGWKVFVLKQQDGADIGKFSKMLVVDGKPVVAYMHLEPTNAGRTRAKIVIARSKVETPHGATDFDFSDVAVDDSAPCRATSCDASEACIKDTGVCTKTVGGCSPACADTDACVSADGKAACQPKMNAVETYPRALGPFISIAKGPSGLGIIAYDGYHGNLMAFVEQGGSWTPVLLDGEAGNRNDKTAVDTGDVGMSSSLAIAPSGTWHISYVNGSDETLRYITMTDGKPGKSVIIDDGTGVDGKPHVDGKHIVGDDSNIRVDGDKITVVYSDSSSLGIRRATGNGSDAFSLYSIKQDNKFVAFPQLVPGEDKIAAWWRQVTRATHTVVGDVTVIAP